MAKFLITLEDLPNGSLRLGMESDNQDSKEYTMAETIAEQNYDDILKQAKIIAASSPEGETSPLN